MWNEVGTKEDYQKEFGDTPLAVLVREIIGLDQKAANEAFSQFLMMRIWIANRLDL